MLSATASRPRRLVAAESECEKRVARQYENYADKRQERIPYVVRTSDEVHERVILEQRNGYHVCEEREHSFAVYGQRIFAVLARAVGQHVHELEPLYREETYPRVEYEQRRIDRHASDHHRQEGHHLAERPDDPAGGHGNAEHYHRLQKPSHSRELDRRRQHLQDNAPRAQEYPVERAAPYKFGEGVEASEEALCERKREQYR